MTPTINAAIQAWVVSASGLAADRVYWSGQDIDRKPGPIITLTWLAAHQRGLGWRKITDSPTPTAGAEIVHTERTEFWCSLGIQCIDGDAINDASSLTILRKVVTKVRLPSIKAALAAADVPVPTFDQVQTAGGTFKVAGFEPRAMVTARMMLALEESETTTYIEHVETEGTLSD